MTTPCKYEPFWQEVSVKSPILWWLLRPVCLLLFNSSSYSVYEWNVVVWQCNICIFPFSFSALLLYWNSVWSQPYNCNTTFLCLLQGTKQCIDVCQKLYPVLQQAVAKAVEDRLSSDHVTWPIISFCLKYHSSQWSYHDATWTCKIYSLFMMKEKVIEFSH